MNCSTCGTQLPPGAANCPQCGTTTPSYSSHARIAPNDPTVVSSPYGDALPAPPPPSPQRPGNRIGIIVGVVLLVLLLIGGGVFAWLAYSSARNAAAVTAQATATAQAHAQGTHH